MFTVVAQKKWREDVFTETMAAQVVTIPPIYSEYLVLDIIITVFYFVSYSLATTSYSR